MKIAICDDQPAILNEMSAKIKTICGLDQIMVFSDINDFFQSIINKNTYDLVFMDINWEDNESGIDFAHKLYTLSPKTKVIFITGFLTTYAQKLFFKSVNLHGILIKPVSDEALKAHIENLKFNINDSELIVRIKNKVVNIDQSEILYIESDVNRALIYTKTEQITVAEKLSDIEKRLTRNFVSTHKSYIVNMDYIQQMDAKTCILDSGIKIPISKSNAKKVRETYFTYANIPQ